MASSSSAAGQWGARGIDFQSRREAVEASAAYAPLNELPTSAPATGEKSSGGGGSNSTSTYRLRKDARKLESQIETKLEELEVRLQN